MKLARFELGEVGGGHTGVNLWSERNLNADDVHILHGLENLSNMLR